MIGKSLSHYTILDELSRGGMGVVYRAIDVNLNRNVAIKVLPPDSVLADQKWRFVQEAQAAAKLEHPNIAAIYRIDEADGVTFIVMELIQGEKLSELLKAGPLALPRALDLGIEVADGLAAAHDKNIVHRDIKPANVMLTREGHAKIIDFGLAKLLGPAAAPGADVVTALRNETDARFIVGTVPYMSPEQARGRKVDHRTDVFSFGITLYEMLTGSHPFRGENAIETLSAILSAAPPPLEQTSDLKGEIAGDLQRIVNKCLKKEPGERYQTMKDLALDLRQGRRRLESGSIQIASVTPARSRAPLLYAGLALVAIATAAVLFRLPTGGDGTRASPSSKPTVAVMYFDNVTGDPGLDWLHTGLAEMLVTDLSQSPRLTVVGTDRLYQILKEMNRLEERVTSLDAVQQVAQKAGAEIVLLGSYMKAGESIRINLRVQEAVSGRILASEKVEGTGENSLFPMVDDLTRRIMVKLDVPGPPPDRGLEEVTTSSVEAYRYYSEAMNLHYQLKEEEAVPLFEKAIDIDPGFAMALARLAQVYVNLGRDNEALDIGSRAVSEADRLSSRERYYVESFYYSLRQDTWARCIETLEKALKEYPDHESIRNNLAARYWYLELNREAVEHGERLRRAKTDFPGTYLILPGAYATLGNYEEGNRALQEFLERNPANAVGYRYLGLQYLHQGRLDEARDAFSRESSLVPSSLWPLIGLWEVAILEEDDEGARRAATKLSESNAPFLRWTGYQTLAENDLYRGRAQEALAKLSAAAAAFPVPGSTTARSNADRAHILLSIGRLQEALEEAEVARRHGEGNVAEWEGLFYQAVALARLGRMPEAEKTALELARRTESIPGPKEKRRALFLRGEMAFARGDVRLALEELKGAEALLTPRGFWGVEVPQHVPIWFALGTAHLEEGDGEEAARYFRRIVESGNERVNWPIEFVRSFYQLGRIHESGGEMEEARSRYRRFLHFWGEGEMDRELVAEARSKL